MVTMPLRSTERETGTAGSSHKPSLLEEPIPSDEDKGLNPALDIISERLEDTTLKSLKQLKHQLVSENEVAKSDLDTLQAKHLSAREDLQEALSKARALKGIQALVDPGYIAKVSEEVRLTRALQKVRHALQYMHSFEQIPQLMSDTIELFQQFDKRENGSADALYEAHGCICALERIRNITLSKRPRGTEGRDDVCGMFEQIKELRKQLDHVLFRDIFAEVITYAQGSPRILVAAIRVVGADEKEDEWWENERSQTRSSKFAAIQTMEGARRGYRSRCLDCIRLAISKTFGEVQSEGMGEQPNDVLNRTDRRVERVLNYVDTKIGDLALVQQYVVPCFPDDYEIASLYLREYYTHIMMMISREVARTPDSPLSRLGRHLIVKWYSRYKAQLMHIGIISLIGQDRQPTCDCCICPSVPAIPYGHPSLISRQTAFVYTVSDIRSSRLQRYHSEQRNGTADESETVNVETEDWNGHVVDYLHETLSRRALALIRSDTALHEGKVTSLEVMKGTETRRSTQLPEALFSLVESELRDVTTLCSPERVARFGLSATASLVDFVRELKAVLVGDEPYDVFLNCEDKMVIEYCCATMNNMTRCIRYCRQCRDRLAENCGPNLHAQLIRAYKEVLEGFDIIARVAAEKILKIVEKELEPLTKLFHQAHSGTEVMLDALQVLDDLLGDCRDFLIPSHFETLLCVCGQMIVYHYLEPFLKKRLRLKAQVIVAQMAKDVENLVKFLSAKLVSHRNKYIAYITAPVVSTQGLLSCRTSPVDMATAFWKWHEALNMNFRVSLSLQDMMKIAKMLWEERGVQKPLVNDVLATLKETSLHRNRSSNK